MRPELKRLTVNACARLGGYQLAGNLVEENARRRAIEDFKTMRAGKLALNTRLELFLGGECLGLESAPADHFTLGGRWCALAGADGEYALLEDFSGARLKFLG